MARIRTIKPDFWTDERLTECSVSARLLFIGMWNFADDAGNLQRSAKKIKMQVFPADSFDVEPLLTELIAHGVLREYSVNGEKFLHIKGFAKHQVINRPSKSTIPPPDFTEQSMSDQGGLTEDSLTEGKGREGKGKEKETHHRTSTVIAGIGTGGVRVSLQGKSPLENADLRESAKRVLTFLNEKTGKRFPFVEGNLGFIVGRLAEGATEQDCKTVIARKRRDWNDNPDMRQWLRPATIFDPVKFAQYLGECVAPTAEAGHA